VLAFLWWRRPRLGVPLRNGLVGLSIVALLVYWRYPVAPPRLTVHGRTDALIANDILGARHVHEGLVNLYAAMPSLHVGWSTWSAFALWPLARKAWVKVLLVVYPVTIFFCIVVTANHWILDAVGGWIVLAAGYAVASLLAKRRRRVAVASPRP